MQKTYCHIKRTKNLQIDFVKIENFKSYHKINIIGPLSGFSAFFGKNGSGKTNFADALNFAFAGSLEEINCFSLQNLFYDPFLNDNSANEAKIMLCIKKKGKRKILCRITNKQNISYFFIDNLKVSFTFYKTFLNKSRVNLFKNFLIIKNILQNNFFQSNHSLTYIIDELSGSKKLLNLHIKLGLLRKKLQKSSIYFFQKLKIIIREKKMKQENDMKKTYSIGFIKSYLKKKNYHILELLCKTVHKIWILSKEKIALHAREISYQDLLITSSFSYLKKQNYIEKEKKIISIKSRNVFFTLIYNLQKILRFIIVEDKKIFSKQFLIIFDSEINFIYKKNHKDCQKARLKIHVFTPKLNFVPFSSKKMFRRMNANLNTLQCPKKAVFKSFHCRKRETKCFDSISKIHIAYNISDMYLFFRKNKIFFTNKIRYDFLQRKVSDKVFYATILLLFILLYVKKNNLSQKIVTEDKQNYIFSVLLNAIKGIRGKMKQMVKPIDSRYRKNWNFLFSDKKDLIIIDNVETGSRCQSFLRQFKNYRINFFLTENNKTGNHSAEQKRNILDKIQTMADFDYYDAGMISFFCQKNQFDEILNKNYYTERIEHHGTTFSCIMINEEQQKKEKTMKISNIKIRYKKILLIETVNKCTEKKKAQKICVKKIQFSYKNEERFLNYKKQKNFSEKFEFSLQRIKSMFLFLHRHWSKKYQKFSKKFIVSINYFTRKNLKDLKVLPFKSGCILSNLTQSRICQFIKISHRRNLMLQKKYKTETLDRKKEIIEHSVTSFFKFGLVIQKELILIQKINSGIKIHDKRLINIEKMYNEYKSNLMNAFYFLNISKKYASQLLQIKSTKRNQLEGLLNILFQRFAFSFLMRAIFLFCQKSKKKDIFNTKHQRYDLDFFCDVINRKGKIKASMETKIKLDNNNFRGKIISFVHRSHKKKESKLIDDRFEFFKKKLVDCRFRFLITNSKFSRIARERVRRFMYCFGILSKQINLTYKDFTKSFSHPFGGTAFLTMENLEQPFLGKIYFTANPPSKNFEHGQHLSGGEKTIASLSLILSLVQIFKQPFILLDEIDSHLDNWHSEKLFLILKKLTNLNILQVCVITLKLRYIAFFELVIFLIKDKFGTQTLSML